MHLHELVFSFLTPHASFGSTDSNDVSYINDFMGYHKVENPTNSLAKTLHLYCPPFQKCKIWLDPNQASATSKVCMCNYSEYGDSHACERFAVNMI